MVLRSKSSPIVKSKVLAYSVKLMHVASILAASCFVIVVFPTHGVPVMRMTRLFMIL